MMFENKTVAITGGASGIGLATAEAFARVGCSVLIGDRDVTALQAATDQLLAAVPGANIDTFSVDVSNEDEVEDFIAAATAMEGELGVLVTCAAIYETCEFINMTGSVWDETTDINLRGTVLCAAAASRSMRGTGGGSIVLMSSIDSLISEPATAAYSAAKSAINSVARSLAVDLTKYGIAINAVAPGWVLTPMTEKDLANLSEETFDVVNVMRRAARPEEIADVIKYVALDAPRFLTGATLFVDGGQSGMAPMPS